jgi:thioredoxin 1
VNQRAYKITVLVGVAIALAGALLWKVSTRSSPAASAPRDQGLPALLDFGKGECTTCKQMEPILKELADAYEGRARIEIVDISERPDMASKYDIDFIPTQVFLDAKGNEAFRNVGPMTRDEMIAKLREIGVK